MPTPPRGPRLGGSPAHERLILANLAQSLFEHGRITTTEAKAKRLRPFAEKLITTAKRGTLHSRREVLKVISSKEIVHRLFADIGPSFATREGGYTRIVKTAPRQGDNAPMALIELITEETVSSAASRTTRRAARTRQAPAAASGSARGSSPMSAGAAAATAEVGDVDQVREDGTQAEQPAVEPPATGSDVVEGAVVSSTEESTAATSVTQDTSISADEPTVPGDADRVREDVTQAEQAAAEEPAEGGSTPDGTGSTR